MHHGHLRRLELAKQQGTFLYVGIWDDEMTRYYKGSAHPVVSLQERVLMTLACKHVDEVVIGAPYVITKDLIQCLNIKKVIHIVDTAEDTPKKEFADVDQFSEVREILKDGLVEVSVNDPFYDLTVEKIAQRVKDNEEALKAKVNKKQTSQNNYESKKYTEGFIYEK